MTPDEIEKEAERIIDELNLAYIADFEELERTKHVIISALRAVYAAGRAEAYPNVHEIGDAEVYKRGFNAAIEKAASVSDSRVSDRYSSDCGVEAEIISDEIRALKVT